MAKGQLSLEDKICSRVTELCREDEVQPRLRHLSIKSLKMGVLWGGGRILTSRSVVETPAREAEFPLTLAVS